ncbi:MAG: 4'-phosphopantetheinyl transferase superfamily protein [Pararhodobacter sp.]|nr:4'-phosphopantetheinyl transferase superfamily protein [Pararhodobacter sp.]
MALLEQVRGLFARDLPLGLGLARIGEGGESILIGAEGDGLGRMVPKRRAEFAAGRLALRRAQAALGVAPFAVASSTNRAPFWPEGFCGSISHDGGVAIAVLGRRQGGLQSLGLDIEEDRALPAELHDSVLLESERAAIAGCENGGLKARTIFSIKECVYKAQYPLSLRLFGFEVIEVALDARRGAFCARFMEDVAPFRAGECITGRYSAVGGLIVSTVALRY